MRISEWARHWRAIEDAREQHDTRLIALAVRHALQHDRPVAADLYAAMADCLAGEPNAGKAMNRALEIALDEYLEDKRRAVA